MIKATHKHAGRNPKLDPITFRCSVNFNAAEQAHLQNLHEKSGVESLSTFIKMAVFGKPLKVFHVDENTRVFIDRLSDFNAQYRTFGVAYDRAVKALELNTTEKRRSATVRELVGLTRELVALNRRIVELAQRFDSQWLQKYL